MPPLFVAQEDAEVPDDYQKRGSSAKSGGMPSFLT